MLQSSIPLSANTDDYNLLRLQKESILEREHYTEMGKKFKAFRTKSHLTVEQAAERLGVSVSTLKLLERGKSLTLDNIMRICLGYGCTIAEIFPDEFSEYTSPFENAICFIGEKQRKSMIHELDRVGKRCRSIER